MEVNTDKVVTSAGDKCCGEEEKSRGEVRGF